MKENPRTGTGSGGEREREQEGGRGPERLMEDMAGREVLTITRRN